MVSSEIRLHALCRKPYVVEEADACGDIDDLLHARGRGAVEVEVDVDLGLACRSGY